MEIDEAIAIAAQLPGWTAYYGAAHSPGQTKPMLYFGRDFQETVASVVGRDSKAAARHYAAYLDQLGQVESLQQRIEGFDNALTQYAGLIGEHREYAAGYDRLVTGKEALEEELTEAREALTALIPSFEKTPAQEAIATLREAGVIQAHGGTIGHTATGFGYREYTTDPRLMRAIRQNGQYADPYDAVKQSYSGSGYAKGV